MLVILMALVLVGVAWGDGLPTTPSQTIINNGIKPLAEPTPLAIRKGLVDQHNLIYEQHKVLYSHEDAMKMGLKENKYVFIYFHSEYCSPCRRIEQTFNNPQVKQALQTYIIYIVDVDREPGILEMYRQAFQNHPFKITGIPFYALVNPYTRKCERWGVGFRSSSEFLYWLAYNR